MGTVSLRPPGRSSSHGDFDDLLIDDHTIYALLAGRAGGQTFFGGTAAGNELVLRGTSAADLGAIRLKSTLILDDVQLAATPDDTAGASIKFDPTVEIGVNYTQALLSNRSTMNINSGGNLFNRIFEDVSTINVDEVPLIFTSWTFAHVFPTYNVASSVNNIALLFLFNWAPAMKFSGVGTSSGSLVRGISITPSLRASSAFGSHETLGVTGLFFNPLWDVVSLATVDFNDCVAVDAKSPSSLFGGSSAGVKQVNDFSAVILRAREAGITLDGNWVGLRGQLVADADHYLIRQESNAKSTFAIGDLLFGVLDAEEILVHMDTANDALKFGPNGAVDVSIWFNDGTRGKVDGHLNLGSSSPAQITVDQNNYAIPTGSSMRTIIRLTTDATRTITGLVADLNDDLLVVVNDGSFDLILAHENASSTAANRITSFTGRDFLLAPDEAVTLWKDLASNRWKILDHVAVRSLSKTITVVSPTASEDRDIFFTDVEITVQAVEGVINNGSATPVVTCQIHHHADRANAGNTVFAAPRAVTSVTTGDDLTLGGDVTIPANSFVWLETTTQGGTTPALSLTLRYVEDL